MEVAKKVSEGDTIVGREKKKDGIRPEKKIWNDKRKGKMK